MSSECYHNPRLDTELACRLELMIFLVTKKIRLTLTFVEFLCSTRWLSLRRRHNRIDPVSGQDHGFWNPSKNIWRNFTANRGFSQFKKLFLDVPVKDM